MAKFLRVVKGSKEAVIQADKAIKRHISSPDIANVKTSLLNKPVGDLLFP